MCYSVLYFVHEGYVLFCVLFQTELLHLTTVSNLDKV